MQVFLALFAVLATVDASARILVGKAVLSKYPIAHQENVYEYQIVNTGDTSAVKVELDDRASFPTDRFKIRSGSPHVKYIEIPPKTTVVHHLVVVPLAPQPMEMRDVVVDYTDSKTGVQKRTAAIPHERTEHDYFYSERALLKITGANSEHLIVFASIVLPMTLSSAFFYWNSVRQTFQDDRKKRRM